jgi:hypothetical protein
MKFNQKFVELSPSTLSLRLPLLLWKKQGQTKNEHFKIKELIKQLAKEFNES